VHCILGHPHSVTYEGSRRGHLGRLREMGQQEGRRRPYRCCKLLRVLYDQFSPHACCSAARASHLPSGTTWRALARVHCMSSRIPCLILLQVGWWGGRIRASHDRPVPGVRRGRPTCALCPSLAALARRAYRYLPRPTSTAPLTLHTLTHQHTTARLTFVAAHLCTANTLRAYPRALRYRAAGSVAFLYRRVVGG